MKCVFSSKMDLSSPCGLNVGEMNLPYESQSTVNMFGIAFVNTPCPTQMCTCCECNMASSTTAGPLAGHEMAGVRPGVK